MNLTKNTSFVTISYNYIRDLKHVGWQRYDEGRRTRCLWMIVVYYPWYEISVWFKDRGSKTGLYG